MGIVKNMTNIGITPSATTVTLTLADTEYSYAVPDGTKILEFYNRTKHDTKFSFEAGKVTTSDYQTLIAGENWGIMGVRFYGKMLYFASASPGDIIEIMCTV